MKAPAAYGFAALNPTASYPSYREAFKLDFIHCDFLMSDVTGRLLKAYLEQRDRGWDRSTTSSEVRIINELLLTIAQSEDKTVSTFDSTTRTPVVLDAMVQMMHTTCHIASAAVASELVADRDERLKGTPLGAWVSDHFFMLSASGGIVLTEVTLLEVPVITEATTFRAFC